MGKTMAEKLNQSVAPVMVVFPLKGLSANDYEGAEFYDKEADMMLLETLEANLREDIPVICLPYHINDRIFAEKTAELVIEMMQGVYQNET